MPDHTDTWTFIYDVSDDCPPFAVVASGATEEEAHAIAEDWRAGHSDKDIVEAYSVATMRGDQGENFTSGISVFSI